MPTGRMRAVFMGTPEYVIPVMDVLCSLDAQVVAVYTQPDKPSGRGRTYEPPPVKKYALERGIEVFQPASLRRAEAQQQLASLRPDVTVVAAYGKILPTEVLNIPRRGSVNVHPSLLPKYRGPSPVATAILNGEKQTGTTLILLDEGMDSGPIIASRAVSIPAEATSESLTPRLFHLGADLLRENLPAWLTGEVRPRPQDDGQATVTRKLERVDGEAQWEITAEELERRLRAFTPWPGLFTRWKGKTLKILSAAPLLHLPEESSSLSEGALLSTSYMPLGEGDAPGLVVPVNHAEVAAGVVTGRGVLGIRTLQLEGKRPVAVGAFLRGYRDFVGSKLPS